MPQAAVASFMSCYPMRNRRVDRLGFCILVVEDAYLLSIDDATSDKERGYRPSTPKSGENDLIEAAVPIESHASCRQEFSPLFVVSFFF